MVIDIKALLELNPDYERALWNGERWALDHMKTCESINAGEPEGFRRPFDGTPRKWCGGACPFSEGCIMCTLPEDPEMARFNRTRDTEIGNPRAGVIAVFGPVDYDMVDRVREMLSVAQAHGVEELEVRIKSDGGDVPAGMAICDMIRNAPVRKRTGMVMSHARSMALIILQACDERIASPDASLLLHHTRFKDVTIQTLRDPEKVRFMVDCAQPDEVRMDALLMARTGKSLDEIYRVCDRDKDMTSQEALKFGLIDRIQ